MADHVFISYSHDDEGFVHRLATNLQARGVPVWVDSWDIPPSADWNMAIDDALYDCAHYLVVLSPASVQSREVRSELQTALSEGKHIVSVLYQTCRRIPRQLRLIQYIDYRERGPDDEAALSEVLRALGVRESGVRARGDAVERADRVPAASKAPSTVEGRKLPGVLTPRQPYEPEMVLIPAGEFLMGSDPAKDKGAEDDEQPQHTLTLPDYYLARTPVTNAQYLAYVRATGRDAPEHWKGGVPPRGKEEHPVVWVTWQDAMAYCRWLSEVTGKAYSLPSEAQWEKGARGTDGRVYPWGDKWDAARCNSAESGKGEPTPVGAYPDGASPYGLLDMAGNVWEWTRSLNKGYPYDPDDGREDLDAGGRRVVRGGSFYYDRNHARCAVRRRNYPNRGWYYFGFRVVSPISP